MKGEKPPVHATVTPQRATLATPYARQAREHAEAQMAKAALPSSFEGRLAWLARVWDEEPKPQQIHVHEVWSGEQRITEQGPTYPRDLCGGSKLGSPAHHWQFRRYIEDSETHLDADGYYLHPLHAALYNLGRHHSLTAHAIWAVLNCGDWRAVATAGGWAEEMFAGFLAWGIGELWREYNPQPRRT